MSSLLEGLASGAVGEAGALAPAGLQAALERGQAMAAATADPALRAGLLGALDAMSAPAAQAALVQAARHEIVAAASFVGLRLGASDRAKFLSDAATSFAQRHAVLASDDQATRQAALDRATVVGSLESVVESILRSAGGAAVPFLLAIL